MAPRRLHLKAIHGRAHVKNIMTMVHRNSRLCLLVSLSSVLAPAHCGIGQTDSVEGYYSSPSKRCTVFDEKKNDLVSCEKQFTDCLRLQKISDTQFAVEIYSTQATQHVCALESTAVVENGVLTAGLTEDKAQRIFLIREHGGIRLKLQIPPNQIPENCGAHASFNGLRFKKNRDSKKTCFQD